MAAGAYIGAASLVLVAAIANYFRDFSSIQNRTSLIGQDVLEDSAAGNRTRSAPYNTLHAQWSDTTETQQP